LWALLGLLPLAWWLWRGAHAVGVWKQWIDPQLQPHVLTQGQAARHWHKRLWLSLLWLLALLALAGPTWEQRPTPLLRSDQARIVVLDLSRSMLANDLRPSRLELARLKVRDLLEQSRDSKAGLVAFAAQAFAIAPLTDDIQTLMSQVPTLHPDLMPAQGGRVDRALLQAQEMLKNGGAGGGGQVLLVTDSKPQEAAFAAAQSLRDMGYELSVLAVGTEQGAPIPEDTRRGRGFVKDRNGNIVVASLPSSELRQLALSGGGQFSRLTADDSDIKKLSKVLAGQQEGDLDSADAAKAGDQWLEAGPYLLLLLLPLAALGFRRGWLLAVCLFVGLPSAPDAYAADEAASGAGERDTVGSSLWFNADQRGKQALDAGDAAQAQQLFESPAWKAAAQYQAGEHQAAADYWAQQQLAESYYNQGNALAHTGDLAGAMAAWQKVPETHALAASAQHNMQVIQPLLEQQQQNQDSDSQQVGDQQDSGDSSQADQQSQNSPQEGEQGAEQEQQSSESESQSNEGQSSEGQTNDSQQQSEQKPSAQNADQQPAESEPAESAEQSAEPSAQEASETDEESGDEQAANAQAQLSPEELAEEQAKQQVIEQWLNRIPDDPGGLLRQKFKRDYQRRAQQRGTQYTDEEQAW
jgi:Ca-activated chloride channel family protein